MSRVVLVPGVLALLPEYASLEDPVADLRAACLDAVGWLGADVTVLADAQGARVGEALVAEATHGAGVHFETVAGRPPQHKSRLRRQSAFTPQPPEPGTSYLVVGNGSACRTEKAPGHLDDRAAAFDADLGRRLADDPGSLAGVDRRLAHELSASVDGIVEMAALAGLSLVQVDYDDDPFGVQYWVIRWASV